MNISIIRLRKRSRLLWLLAAILVVAGVLNRPVSLRGQKTFQLLDVEKFARSGATRSPVSAIQSGSHDHLDMPR